MANGEDTGPIEEWIELEGKPGRALKLADGRGWVHTHTRKGKQLLEWVNRTRVGGWGWLDNEADLRYYDPAKLAERRAEEHQEEYKDQVKLIEGQMAKDVLDTYWTIGSTKYKEAWVEELEKAAANDKMFEVTDDTLDEAEEEIRIWLTLLNDICRIASFFHADGVLDGLHDGTRQEPGNGLITYLEQMFADENLPEIKAKPSRVFASTG
jgi:hypothetical protein